MRTILKVVKNLKERPYLELGKCISKIRNTLGWNQDDLSDKSGVAISALKDIERGVAEGHLTTRQALAKALGCNVSDFYDWEGGAPKAKLSPGNVDVEGVLQLLSALSRASSVRRLSVLYLLMKDEKYLREIEKLPSGLPIALALKRVL